MKTTLGIFRMLFSEELSLGPAVAQTQPPPAPEPVGSWPTSVFGNTGNLMGRCMSSSQGASRDFSK